MQQIDLSGFKVVYKERVLRALCLVTIMYDQDDFPMEGKTTKPKFLEVLVLNEDGNVVSIYDEAWMFQFIILQMMLCGDMQVIAECVYRKDYESKEENDG